MEKTKSINKYLVGICSLNEGDKILRVVRKFCDYHIYDVLILDDGSTDGSLDQIPTKTNIILMRNDQPKGAGYGTRQIIDFAIKKGYEGVFFVSGNDKDDPADIYKLQEALEQGYDFVQGSRYLKGGKFGGMPKYRRIATQVIHPWIFSLISGKRITDSTNGFRGIKLAMIMEGRINLNQAWLDQYELEPYLFYQAIKCSYRVKEVPVSKIYPSKKEGYTKMRPFVGWWSILRPLVYLGLRIKR